MSTRDQMWDRVYNTSRDVYTDIPGYGDSDARLTADAATAGWYVRSGGDWRRRRLSGLRNLPAPGNMLFLGCFLDLEYVTSDGEIQGCGFETSDCVPLLWSDDLQALIVLPFAKDGKCIHPPRTREDQLARVWAKGRPAACSLKSAYSRPPMHTVYPAVQVSYSSDKFSWGKNTDYIHHHERGREKLLRFSGPGRGPCAYFSKEPFRARRAPEAIMVRGGKLRLTSHGIDG